MTNLKKISKGLAARLGAILSGIVLLTAISTDTAIAHETSRPTSGSSENLSSVIWSGLWAGANLDINSVFTEKKPAETHAQTPATTGQYVALGDSVAAGAGLPLAQNATAEDRRCKRSAQTYPYQVAQSTNLPLLHTACSGATAGDLVTKQRPGGVNLPPQLDVAFAGGTPALITITAGANDADWSGFVYKCYARRCNSEAFTKLADARLKVLKTKLHYAFVSIKARSGTNPPLVVATGYYNPLSDRCARLTDKVTPDEIDWLSTQTDKLNATIREVSAYYSFVRYADVDFTGHDICSEDPWIQGLADADPFHPTAAGQAAIARSITNAL